MLGQLYLQALQGPGLQRRHHRQHRPAGGRAPGAADGVAGDVSRVPRHLIDQTLAGDRRHFRSRRTALAAGRRWARRHSLRLLAPTPFSDTDAIAVTDAYGAAHRLRTLVDLRRVGAMLTIGGAQQFRSDAIGLTGLSGVYGVAPARFAPLAVGDQYAELATGAVQAAYVNTTDGQLASGDYRVLSRSPAAVRVRQRRPGRLGAARSCARGRPSRPRSSASTGP